MAQIERVEAGGDITLWSAKGAAPVIAAARRIARMRAEEPLELVQTADGGLLLRLKAGSELPGAGDGSGSAGFLNEAQSATASCPTGTTGTDVTVTVAAGTLSSPISVADANDLAIEIATFRAQSMLTCATDSTIDGAVAEMVKNSAGEIIIRGLFTNVGGFDRFQIALLKSDLTVGYQSWKFIASGSPGTTTISAIAVDADDNIYAVGPLFTQVDNLYWTGLAQLSPNGGVNGGYYAPTFTPDIWTGHYPTIFSGAGAVPVTLFWDSADTRMFVCGSFTRFGDITALVGMVTIDDTGTGTFFNNAGTNNIIGMIASAGGDFYIWGTSFDKISNVGTKYLTFNPSSGGLSSVPSKNGLAIQGGNLIVVGGVFIVNSTGVNSYGLARISATTGNVDHTFYSYTHSAFGIVSNTNCVIVQSDGKIIIGGNFGTYNGVTINTHLIRLNADGSPDPTWTTSANDIVSHLLIEDSGTILVCGFFTAIGPDPAARIARSRIARLTSEGDVL